MYEYNVCPTASNERFSEMCHHIERSMPDIVKGKLLIDVDGTGMQRYSKDGKKIMVINDYDVDAVYIESEIEIAGLK